MVKFREPRARSKRETDVREPKITEKPHVAFSFEYFINQDSVGQSLETWSDSKLLVCMLQKMVHISSQTPAQAMQDQTLTIYDDFPIKSVNDFTCPQHLSDEKNWGVLRNIGKQKVRIAGFLKGNIFYVVYLDKDHKFWKSSKHN